MSHTRRPPIRYTVVHGQKRISEDGGDRNGSIGVGPASVTIRQRGLVRSSDALGPVDAGGRRSGKVRPRVLARLLQAYPLRRRLLERRWMRGLLSHQGPAALSQPMARKS